MIAECVTRAGYQGLQINPGAKTIEQDLEEALYQAGCIAEANRGQLTKVRPGSCETRGIVAAQLTRLLVPCRSTGRAGAGRTRACTLSETSYRCVHSSSKKRQKKMVRWASSGVLACLSHF
jgi:hypothetical protein